MNAASEALAAFTSRPTQAAASVAPARRMIALLGREACVRARRFILACGRSSIDAGGFGDGRHASPLAQTCPRKSREDSRGAREGFVALAPRSEPGRRTRVRRRENRNGGIKKNGARRRLEKVWRGLARRRSAWLENLGSTG
jgi:hypothetical protein